MPLWLAPLLKSAWKFLLAIPPIVYVGLLALVFALASGHYRTQRNEARAEFAAHVQADKDAAAKAKALAAERGKVTVRVETKYVDRLKVIHERGQTITKEVPVYVPANACALPGGFRLLHDAAALGLPLPGPAAIADAAPVPAQDAARTVTGNYTGCLRNAEALNGWNEWAAEQKALNP